MSARPGSIGWLMRHEFRLFWFTTLAGGASKGTRRLSWRVVVIALLVWLLLHLGVLALLRASGSAEGMPPQFVLAGVTALLVSTFLFMLSSALKASVDTLFDRGDMDLLLSSPLSSLSIFGVKLAGMAGSVSALYLFFLAPIAHVGVLLGQLRWLALYPVLLSMAAVASSAAMLLTLALVRLLGPRRTRVLAQILGALTGALLFILSQAGTFMAQGPAGSPPSGLEGVMGAARTIDPASLLWLPARAVLGDGVAVLVMAGLGVLAALATVKLTHRFFVEGVQQAAGMGKAAKPDSTRRYRFDRSLAGTVIVKEWRLIRRDPQLISQVLLQLLYLLPLCFVVFREGTLQLPSIGAGLTMLCGSLAASLAWIILMGEDAPDLLQTSPASAATVRKAKLAAAVLPVLALAALPLVWLTLRAPQAGALTAAAVTGSVLSAALINRWTGRPTARGEFASRNRRNLLTSLLELCNLLAWAGLALLLLRTAGGEAVDIVFAAGIGAAAAVALGMAPLAYLLRHRGR